MDGFDDRPGSFPAGPPVRNSPFAIAGVLALVLALVGVVALAGRATRPVAGTALVAPGAGPGVVIAPPVGPASGEAAPPRAAALGTNPLLTDRMSLQDVTCVLPELDWSQARLRGFYEAALGCLDEAWRPVLEGAGATFDDAELDLRPDGGGECGDMPGEDEATAFYCGSDETIYMPSDRLLDYLGLYRPAHLAVLAHEYGHHVQYLSGMLEAVARELRGVEQAAPEELELTRRIELQANCFAGLFLASAAGRGSVPRAQAEEAVADFRNSVDSETHGTLENQLRWAHAGFEANSTAACNTWDAPAAEVA
ncbi:neutral zinc metallopeptidase [Qaidamihabitans albus]|uniref:neutral zinc metallopeptidase n=1 Tax=Qaidamihabitans albus TaxID=2795733 RepID=UPI0027DE3744|nr:neutral zinc metallopeptidase [Qaidamihabitans albus]